MNKPITRVLLTVVVLGIWGVVGFRIYRNYYPEEVSAEAAITTTMAPPLQLMANEPYELRGEYPDPFGRSLTRKHAYRPAQARSNAPKNNPPRNNRISTPKEANPQWPQVVYKGAIANDDRKSTGTALISIDNVLKRVNAGESYRGVKVVSYDRDQLTVEFNGEKRTLEKNK